MNAEATPSTTRRFLSSSENFKLCKWYEENQVRLLTVTDEGIRAEAETTLKIDGIKDSHIQAARRALGIQKRKQRKEDDKDLSALEALIAEQAADISTLKLNTQALLDRVRRLEAQSR